MFEPGGEAFCPVYAFIGMHFSELFHDLLPRHFRAPGGLVVAFTHGHLSRVLTARLLGLPLEAAGALYNDTASIAVIEDRRGDLVLTGWNITAD